MISAQLKKPQSGITCISNMTTPFLVKALNDNMIFLVYNKPRGKYAMEADVIVLMNRKDPANIGTIVKDLNLEEITFLDYNEEVILKNIKVF